MEWATTGGPIGCPMKRHPQAITIDFAGRSLLWGQQWHAPLLLSDDESEQWADGQAEASSRLAALGYFSDDRPLAASRLRDLPIPPAWARALNLDGRAQWFHQRPHSVVALLVEPGPDERLAGAVGARPGVRDASDVRHLSTIVIGSTTTMSLGEPDRTVVWDGQLLPVIMSEPDAAVDQLRSVVDSLHLAADEQSDSALLRGLLVRSGEKRILLDLEFVANLDALGPSSEFHRSKVEHAGWFPVEIGREPTAPFDQIICSRRANEPPPRSFHEHALGLILRSCNRPLDDSSMQRLAQAALECAQIPATFTSRIDARLLDRDSVAG